MTIDKNNPPLQAPSTTKPVSTNTVKEHNTLLPKTIEEIKEIQERVSKRWAKKKYIGKNRLLRQQQQQPKSEEDLKLEELQRLKDIKELAPHIMYSPCYQVDEFEYRHVVLSVHLSRWLPQDRLLVQKEWIEVGVHQSSGWQHYMIYKSEPHVLLLKREKNYLIKYGYRNSQYPPEQVEQIKKQRQQP